VGIGYVLLHGGASPQVTTPAFTLSLLVMVVLGGPGTRWGALLGGVVYTLLDQRLAVLASSSHITALPAVLRVPLSQPLFLLGTLFCSSSCSCPAAWPARSAGSVTGTSLRPPRRTSSRARRRPDAPTRRA